MSQNFEKLLTPGNIGKMKVRNRIVVPPMVRGFAYPDGIVTRRLIDHYTTMAKGGAGLIIVEATFVHQSGKLFTQDLGIHDDKCIPGLSDLASAIKEWGSKAAIQLVHSGRQTTTAVTGMPTLAPSTIPCPVSGGFPKELSIEQIIELVESFAQGARRAKEAGFDAIEVHAAHGYLINQFLAPNTNRRTDKYGGDINQRMTFLIEVIQEIRKIVGVDFPMLTRINSTDYVDGGLELEEAKQVAKKLEAVGVDALDVSAGIYATGLTFPRRPSTGASMYEPRGHIINDAEEIKKVVNLPVITVGSITAEIGDKVLQQGKADFIAIGRGHLADPEIGNKLMAGEPEKIRPCIRCSEMCRKMSVGIKCSVNAEVGFESYKLTVPLRRKKVLIAGGGVAGMEAARVAALRGHHVTLCEKTEILGGLLNAATVPSFKEDLKKYKEWLIRQMESPEIKIELCKEVTAQMVSEIKPEVVIIGTGASAFRLNIPGIEKPFVTTAIDILLGKAHPGEKTIIVGGGAVGCETALYLAQQGKKVTIVEMIPGIAQDALTIKAILLTRLTESGVEMITETKIIEITDDGVTGIEKGRNIININGDKVVLATGLVSETRLYDELKGLAHEIYVIGDALEPRRVGKATSEGYRIGSTI
ncbi:MAG TPA: FAD-dependent oxidoreductase [Desulfobacteraceae bacterium]|nr:FAD-dependent oxidoreductase [Desulfobacteraceae bacterium]HPJ66810.1 FAD-dependent oxidoreductase [Desulfobacteraceae bacterium]HPQ27020.1 FAD-dependent oxidoreductase [Desulfobacteraceae bacterium]